MAGRDRATPPAAGPGRATLPAGGQTPPAVGGAMAARQATATWHPQGGPPLRAQEQRRLRAPRSPAPSRALGLRQLQRGDAPAEVALTWEQDGKKAAQGRRDGLSRGMQGQLGPHPGTRTPALVRGAAGKCPPAKARRLAKLGLKLLPLAGRTTHGQPRRAFRRTCSIAGADPDATAISRRQRGCAAGQSQALKRGGQKPIGHASGPTATRVKLAAT